MNSHNRTRKPRRSSIYEAPDWLVNGFAKESRLFDYERKSNCKAQALVLAEESLSDHWKVLRRETYLHELEHVAFMIAHSIRWSQDRRPFATKRRRQELASQLASLAAEYTRVVNAAKSYRHSHEAFQEVWSQFNPPELKSWENHLSDHLTLLHALASSLEVWAQAPDAPKKDIPTVNRRKRLIQNLSDFLCDQQGRCTAAIEDVICAVVNVVFLYEDLDPLVRGQDQFRKLLSRN